ncbi:TetR/AcrR family transcriptional regulator [Streptomyces aidingensis]|uniref:DNA-binding transcriptional regulator, AcrR family n=1 Tax=Streptomyces aidingensis TaxID=910347 RepID=A0A1I1FTD3_9ACTN|nr:TetR/AcrR family transcriptional regulator [Streptomyces aidingensis]SFC00230.1 DNA-binding transcriptional regulator, AcrR family [Streptomyces aidingensis]
MTDSPLAERRAGGRRGGKRERLIGAALDLLHRQGVARTSLAQVAEAADVPLGNVYYYFKTKDDLVRAVIDAHAERVRATFAAYRAAHPDPRDRLKAFAAQIGASGGYAARHGCPMGSLCSELDKREDGGLDQESATLMTLGVDWVREQFQLLGHSAEDAGDLAVTFISVFQGASLLSNTFRDPGLMSRQAAFLTRWIDDQARAG